MTDTFHTMICTHPDYLVRPNALYNQPFDEELTFCDETNELIESLQFENEDMDAYSTVYDYLLQKKIGNGQMKYIYNKFDRLLFTSAWKLLTNSNNWDYVAKNKYFGDPNDVKRHEICDLIKQMNYHYIYPHYSFVMKALHWLYCYGEYEFMLIFESEKFQ